MFCSSCGKQIPDDVKFCMNCGAPQAGGRPVSSSPPPPPIDPDATLPLTPPPPPAPPTPTIDDDIIPLTPPAPEAPQPEPSFYAEPAPRQPEVQYGGDQLRNVGTPGFTAGAFRADQGSYQGGFTAPPPPQTPVKKKKKTGLIIGIVVAALLVAAIVVGIVVLLPMMKYNKAVKLLGDKDYLAAETIFRELDDYKDSRQQITACRYGYAKQLMAENSFEEAIEIFEELEDYKESEDLMAECKVILSVLKLADAKVGDVVRIGRYEQDNNLENGPEELEWQVLDKADGKLLLITVMAPDCQPYHTDNVDITWEDCFLRGWLNNEFYKASFDEVTRRFIVTTTCVMDKNPEYPGNDPGNNTQDRIFCLSISEVERYFPIPIDRLAIPTAYAIANNAYSNSETSAGWWWLRTPGEYQSDAAGIYVDNGEVSFYGYYADCDDNVVRPAMWISFELEED